MVVVIIQGEFYRVLVPSTPDEFFWEIRFHPSGRVECYSALLPALGLLSCHYIVKVFGLILREPNYIPDIS